MACARRRYRARLRHTTERRPACGTTGATANWGAPIRRRPHGPARHHGRAAGNHRVLSGPWPEVHGRVSPGPSSWSRHPDQADRGYFPARGLSRSGRLGPPQEAATTGRGAFAVGAVVAVVTFFEPMFAAPPLGEGQSPGSSRPGPASSWSSAPRRGSVCRSGPAVDRAFRPDAADGASCRG